MQMLLLHALGCFRLGKLGMHSLQTVLYGVVIPGAFGC